MTEPLARRQRRLFLGLALLFFLPLALSFYLYYGHSHLAPEGRVNRGTLIEPVRAVPQAPMRRLDGRETSPDLLRGKWTLLYVASGACGDECRGRLYDMRQVRVALDRDMMRVQRVLVAPQGCCDEEFLRAEHPDLVALSTDSAAPLLEILPQGAGRIYIIDPLGNLMMEYTPDAAPKGLLEDMKRLLRLSHIG